MVEWKKITKRGERYEKFINYDRKAGEVVDYQGNYNATVNGAVLDADSAVGAKFNLKNMKNWVKNMKIIE